MQSEKPDAPSRARVSICDICGKEMPRAEISTHQQMLHAEALQERQRATQAAFRGLMTIYALASAVVLVAILTPVYVFGLRAPPGWDVVAAFTGWFASIVAGIWYAWKKTRVVLDNLLYQCWYCEVPIPKKDLPVHLRTEHPREARYLRISGYVVFGSLFGIVGAFCITWAAVFPDLPLPFVLVGALFTWVGLVILWDRLVYSHRTSKAQAAWRATHLGSQSDPK